MDNKDFFYIINRIVEDYLNIMVQLKEVDLVNSICALQNSFNELYLKYVNTDSFNNEYEFYNNLFNYKSNK